MEAEKFLDMWLLQTRGKQLQQYLADLFGIDRTKLILEDDEELFWEMLAIKFTEELLLKKINNGLQLECSAPSLKTTNDRVVP